MFPGSVVQSMATLTILSLLNLLIHHLTQRGYIFSGLILGLEINLQNLFNLCLCLKAPGTSRTITLIKPLWVFICLKMLRVKFSFCVFRSDGNILPTRDFTNWAEKVKIQSPPSVFGFQNKLNFSRWGYFYVLKQKWGNVRFLISCFLPQSPILES